MNNVVPSPGEIAHRTFPPELSVQPPTSPIAVPRHSDGIRSFIFFKYRGDDLFGSAAGEHAWSSAIQNLADLAEEEDWNGPSEAEFSLPILRSYIRFTYRKLAMEGKILESENGDYAAFNTGLLTEHSEEIFCFMQRNFVPDAQPWFFRRWATESDRDIMKFFPDTPQLAEYFRNTGDLVYDWRRELKFDFTHILNDNLQRFPSELQSSPARARSALVSATDLTLKRVRRNYKLIVPQWYPFLGEDGSGFFIPLDLRDTGVTDLALVVSEVGQRAYRAHTVLTLEMAYANARVVARPDSGWLKPLAPSIETEDDVHGFTVLP